jgi:flagellar biosynthesis protein FlhF
MNVKRFVAPNMQEALKQIREELGADAVILSNEKVEQGIEIVAALDYDEESASAEISVEGEPSPSKIAKLHAQKHIRLQDEMGRAKQHIQSVRKQQERARAGSVSNERTRYNHSGVGKDDAITVTSEAAWADLSKVREEIESLKGLISQGLPQSQDVRSVMSVPQQQIQKRLSSLSISPSIQDSLLSSVKSSVGFDEAWPAVKQEMEQAIGVEYGEIIDHGGVIALVGPTGSGKTMTIGKLAARYVMKFGPESIALVTTDRYRIAAHEQLKVFGRILNVPVHSVDEQHCLDSILDKLADKKLVLIDTAGLMPTDPCWAQQLQELKMSAHRVQPYLVVSAVGQYQVMCSNYHHYKMANLAGTIITKVDEAVSLGEVISFLIDSRLRVAYFTDGQRVPEDIHRLDTQVMLEKAEALLNSSERWVTIHTREAEATDDSMLFHSA